MSKKIHYYKEALALFNLQEDKFFKTMDREGFSRIADRYIEHSAIISDDKYFEELDTAKTYLLTRWPEPVENPKQPDNKLSWWDRISNKG